MNFHADKYVHGRKAPHILHLDTRWRWVFSL